MDNSKELEVIDQALPEKSTKEVKKDLVISHVQEEMEKLIPLAGTIELNDDQKKILFASVKEEDVEIRPDGLVYLPWMEYVSRLRDAFGISWAIIPKDMPLFKGNHIYWPFYFVIQGKFAGFAIGEQQYIPTNAQMTYADACEGAKSNALMRLCKGIGISLELWKPSFIRTWKEKYAEQYEDKGKKLWRKKSINGDLEFEEIKKTSEKKCSELHDRMTTIKNNFELQNWWKKEEHQKDIISLMPEHQKILIDLKDSLKLKFEGDPNG